MNKLTKAVATLGTAAALALTTTAVAQTANAAPAQAVTTTWGSYYVYKCIGPDLWGGRYVYYDYSWYEEVFLGKRDYSVWHAEFLSKYHSASCSPVSYA